MNLHLSILVIIIALMAGAMAIFLANRMMRKYPLHYLSSYFYYLIFSYIFGVYSILGSQMVLFLLADNDIPERKIQSATSFLLILGVPFLIIGWYMFLRLTRDFFQSQLSNIFTYSYFVLSTLLFAAYILLNIYDGRIGSIRFYPGTSEVIYFLSGMQALIMGYGLSYILIKNRKTRDVNQRQAYKVFAIWYTLIISLNLTSIFLIAINESFGLLFILGYLGFNIIPVLFLHLYLQKHYVAIVDNGTFQDKMADIISKFKISKREAEVFELICKGMSNQEISDSLFISLQTVKDHNHNIFLKTGVKNRVQLTNLAGN